MKRFSLNPEALRTPAGAASAAFTFAALIALLWGICLFPVRLCGLDVD